MDLTILSIASPYPTFRIFFEKRYLPELIMFFVDKKNKNFQNSVLQLIESRRINGKPKQEIVVSLGANFKIPKRLRREVARVVTSEKNIELIQSPDFNFYSGVSVIANDRIYSSTKKLRFILDFRKKNCYKPYVFFNNHSNPFRKNYSFTPLDTSLNPTGFTKYPAG